MEFLKHYFSVDHRISRKPYIIAIILFFLISMGIGSLSMSSALTSQYIKSTNELTQQKINKTISEQEYNSKMMSLQLQMQNAMSPWANVLNIAMTLLLLPAIAMRLKDINYSPLWSLGFLMLPLILLAERLSGTLEFSALIMTLSIIELVVQILLVFIRGTEGANRYGSDPLASDSSQ